MTAFPTGDPEAQKARRTPRWLGPAIAGGVVLLIASAAVTGTGANDGGEEQQSRPQHSPAWEKGYDFGFSELGPNSGAGWASYPDSVDGLANYCVDVLGIHVVDNPRAFIRGCGHGLHDFLQ